MMKHETKGNKLKCDICGKYYKTLGGYTEPAVAPGEDWWVCLKCFEKADAMAEKEDCWPNEVHFRRLQEQVQHK
jgi:hypothetical protein